jgi:small multidrug resistance pump
MTLTMLTDGWIALAIAIIFGVIGTVCMKLSNGLRNIRYTIYLSIFYTISFAALTLAINYIELSIVYSVWSGIGTVIMAAVGVFHFNESYSWRKFIFLLLIVVGVIGVTVNPSLQPWY